MKRKELLNRIEAHELDGINLVYGKETYLVEEIENRFKTLPNPDMMDFNLSVIDGRETYLEDLISAFETLPFMDEKRYVIVKDFELLKGKRKNFSESDEKEFLKFMEKISPTTVILFTVEGDVDARKSIYKKIDRLGSVCRIDRLDDISLLYWCREEFNKRKVGISDIDIGYMIDMSGYKSRNSEMTLSDILNEINKLSSYVGAGNTVTKKEIGKLQIVKNENDIFQLLEMIATKNSTRSFKILTDMMEDGVSVLSIFGMLSKHFNQMLKIKSLQREKMSSKKINEIMKMHPYAFDKLQKHSRYYNEETIVKILNYISDSDFKIKQGLIGDRLAAEILIARYCY